jgi:TetR/AcrR family transcriptional regulator
LARWFSILYHQRIAPPATDQALFSLDIEYTDRYIRVVEARDRIKDEATRLFTGHGYEAVGVQEIVEAAGVTKPTLYHHFGSKRGLLVELLGEIRDELWPALATAAEYAGDLPHTLEAVATALLEYTHRRPRAMRLYLAAHNAPPQSEARDVIQPHAGRLTESVSGVFRSAIVQHGNMRGRHNAYTASFLGTVFTYATLLLDGGVTWDPGLPHRIVHQFSHGIYS